MKYENFLVWFVFYNFKICHTFVHTDEPFICFHHKTVCRFSWLFALLLPGIYNKLAITKIPSFSNSDCPKQFSEGTEYSNLW